MRLDVLGTESVLNSSSYIFFLTLILSYSYTIKLIVSCIQSLFPRVIPERNVLPSRFRGIRMQASSKTSAGFFTSCFSFFVSYISFVSYLFCM